MRNSTVQIINAVGQISDLIDELVCHNTSRELYKPTIYIDLEGVNLCREGCLHIFTLLIDTGIPTTRVYLIDVHLFGPQTFNTTGLKNTSLKGTLQDQKIPKAFFDVHNDSDALFAYFDVALQGVEDIQLMESAKITTTTSRRYLTGLTKCVDQCLVLDVDRARWRLAKKEGERLFKAEHSRSSEIFNQRPIPEKIISYCVVDVQCLPNLRSQFSNNTDSWAALVHGETKKRVAASQQPEYQPHGRNKAFAPWSADQNRTLDQLNPVPRPHRGHFFNENDDWEDDMRTNCRDVIDPCDYHFYYCD